jgi:hypothetical protein
MMAKLVRVQQRNKSQDDKCVRLTGMVARDSALMRIGIGISKESCGVVTAATSSRRELASHATWTMDIYFSTHKITNAALCFDHEINLSTFHIARVSLSVLSSTLLTQRIQQGIKVPKQSALVCLPRTTRSFQLLRLVFPETDHYYVLLF